MTGNGISERVKNFIFLYIDSVELLEVLLIFQRDEKKVWNAHSIASEIRSNPSSIAQRILLLKSLSLVSESSEVASEHFYDPASSEMREITDELASAYRIYSRA